MNRNTSSAAVGARPAIVTAIAMEHLMAECAAVLYVDLGLGVQRFAATRRIHGCLGSAAKTQGEAPSHAMCRPLIVG
jgi:hypothetical protein